MNASHIHLVITHFPIVGTLIGIGILTFGLFMKNDVLKKTALIIFILMSVITIPVIMTGEAAEETVEHISGISENIIEEHEEFAEKASLFMLFLGILSVVGLFGAVSKMPFAKNVILITFIVSLAVFGMFAKVANLGGQIRHSEIRTNNNVVQEENNNKIEKHHNKDHEEDDDDDD